jgi:hypothetical protein
VRDRHLDAGLRPPLLFAGGNGKEKNGEKAQHARFIGRPCAAPPHRGNPPGGSGEAEVEPAPDLVDRRKQDPDGIAKPVSLAARAPAKAVLLLFVHEEIRAERRDWNEPLDEEILERHEEAE